jgi:hypothetical protein
MRSAGTPYVSNTAIVGSGTTTIVADTETKPAHKSITTLIGLQCYRGSLLLDLQQTALFGEGLLTHECGKLLKA